MDRQTDRQTDKQTEVKTTFFFGGGNKKFALSECFPSLLCTVYCTWKGSPSAMNVVLPLVGTRFFKIP